jgi:hypothetical protein
MPPGTQNQGSAPAFHIDILTAETERTGAIDLRAFLLRRSGACAQCLGSAHC